MVYIASDGSVHETPPWGIAKLSKFFYGIIFFIVYFFKSLVGLDTSSPSSRPAGSGRFFGGSSGGGSGGGGGGGGGPFKPGGGGPSKRIMTMRDINPPTVGGGCPGGACGL